MLKEILSETFYVTDFLPESSKVDNNLVHSLILNDYAKQSFSTIFENKYNDVFIKYHQQYGWIFDYIRDQFYIKYNISLRLEKTIANVEGYLESTFKRNQVDLYDIKGSPDYTILYFVQGEGDLVIEWSDHRDLNRYLTVEFESKKIIIFNSDLNYYLTKNTSQDLRSSIIFTAKKVQ
jgi:hypothetical protein